MSKVFIVRFSRYSIYKVQCLAALAVSLAILSHPNLLVKYFFQVFQLFSKFFSLHPVCGAALADSFDIITDTSPFVKHFLQISSRFFVESADKNRGAYSAPLTILYCLIPRHRSSRNRHHFCDRQQRRNRHCPHRGRRRSCDPEGSSAGPLPRGSWV